MSSVILASFLETYVYSKDDERLNGPKLLTNRLLNNVFSQTVPCPSFFLIFINLLILFFICLKLKTNVFVWLFRKPTFINDMKITKARTHDLTKLWRTVLVYVHICL